MKVMGRYWYQYVLLGVLLGLPIVAQAAPILGDVSIWLTNLQKQIPSILRLIVAISYVTGILFMVLGVFKLKAYGQMTIYQSANASMSGPLVFFFIGVTLIAFPAMVDVMLYTLWGYGSDGVPPYPGGTEWAYLVGTTIGIIQIVGYVSFLRGWLLLSKMGTSGTQPGTLSKGIIRIAGGILAINVMGTWEILRNTIMGG